MWDRTYENTPCMLPMILGSNFNITRFIRVPKYWNIHGIYLYIHVHERWDIKYLCNKHLYKSDVSWVYFKVFFHMNK